MRVQCPKCLTTLRFPDELSDRVGRCPRCHARIPLSRTPSEPPPTHAFSLAPGDTFAGLRIEKPLGAGGMAEVYLATQLSLGRHVAVKILPDWLTGNPQALARFDREAQALAALRHPHIVSVIDRGTTPDGRNFIVMDYIEGENLRALMSRGILEADPIRRIMEPLCDALAHAHDRHIVHRDLKPENILLDPDGRPHVADFGIARLIGPEAPPVNVTATNAIVGTRGYMAPEQVGAAREADHRADLYALGVILYEMITGDLPLGAWKPASQLRTDFPYDVDEVLARALATRPDDRFPSALAFADALRKAMQDAEAPPPQATRRRPILPVAVAGVAVTLGLLFLLIALRAPSERHPANGGEPPALEQSAPAPVEPVPAEPSPVLPEPSQAPEPAPAVSEVPALKAPPGFRAAPDAVPEPHSQTGYATEIIHEKTGTRLLFIPAGRFKMGSHLSAEETGQKYGGAIDWMRNELPLHEVRITRPFYMGNYEVTQGIWESLMGYNPSQFKSADNPVDHVSWNDCQEFLKRAGDDLRLPTEAEWEYACRAGTDTVFSFGDDPNDLHAYAWYAANSSGTSHPVGRKLPNPWGLYDMHGNVFEWVADWYASDAYVRSDVEDPVGPDTGSFRVIRGGSWLWQVVDCRSSMRAIVGPADNHAMLGFRVALSVPVTRSP
ncbi:MAG: SUMF1/EgtB/PvdO family nonheme iron enzyme [Planctomycetota bacterium]